MRERIETEIRREQIAEAALRLMLEKGVGALTVKEIAAAVGVTAPALYRHYAGKTEILGAVIDHIFSLHAEALQKARREAAGPVPFLRAMYDHNIGFIRLHNGFPALLVSDLLWLEQPELAGRIRREHALFMEEMIAVVRKGQTRGEIRNDLGAKEIFMGFLNSYATLGALMTRNLVQIDLARQAEVNWMIFEEFLRPR